MSNIGISPKGNKFKPLLFAGDINVYSVARAFHEAYGVISTVYGKYPTGPCMNSKIIDYRPNEKADEPEEFYRLVCEFAAENKDVTVILMGCGDSYVELAARFKPQLPENVIAPYISDELMNTLINKEKFYEFCERVGVDYPDTFVHRKEMGKFFKLPFDGPFIIKPASGIEYWKHPYPTQKKVYKVDTLDELQSVLSDIYGSGYEESVIIQNFIPGDDSYMRVLTSYSDRNGRVVMMCLGHVLLEEHTPHGIGNHAVILTECDRQLMEKYRVLLEEMGYTGWSNFDIKFDSRDGKFKAFEINTRQGRSNYYVTGSGANVADYVVRDRLDEEDMELRLVDVDSLWMVVPHKVAYDYVNPKYTAVMKKLVAEGKVCNPLYYDPDDSLKKKYAVTRNVMGHFVKYKKYLGKK